MQQYLETMYRVGGGTDRVAVSTLAEQMEVSTVSAGEMVKRLAAMGLVEYEPYRGARLTEAGRAEALSLLRRHRLWERLLTDVLGLPWDRVHEEACRLEHATSATVEEHLAEFLEEPDACPHGHPMPSADGRVEVEVGCPLDELAPGDHGVVLRVPEGDPTVLQYLASLGLQPGALIGVEAVAPFDGPITVDVAGERQVLGRDMAARIPIRRQPDSTEPPRCAWRMLNDVEPGTEGVIRRLAGGQAFVSRLAALGFSIGAKLTVLQNFGRGPLIVLVRDTRVALGRGEARLVEIEPLAPSTEAAGPARRGARP